MIKTDDASASPIESFLQSLMGDTRWTDICLQQKNPSFQDLYFWIDRGNGLEPMESGKPVTQRLPATTLPFDRPPEMEIDAIQLKTWTLLQLGKTGKAWDAQYPYFDFQHPFGLRIHVILPPLSPNGIAVSMRRLHFRSADVSSPALSAAISAWKMDPNYSLLKSLVLEKKSGIICGSTGSGKTTLLNNLLSELDPTERIIALEDTPELSSVHPGFLNLQSRLPNAEGKGEVTLRDLLRQTLRMRPDRLILGECRGAEVLDLLQILNTGHQGALATLHAHSARDALRRLELLVLLATEGRIQTSLLRELIAHGIEWVAFLKNAVPFSNPFSPLKDTKRHIAEILQIKGLEGHTILTTKICRR